MPNPKIQWLFYSEYGRRLLALRRMLAVTELQWNCYGALVEDRRPIAESALASLLNCPRSTVRTVIVQGIACGLIERTPAGLALTELGFAATAVIYSETYEIVLGMRKGYSSDSIKAVNPLITNARRRARLEQMKQVHFCPAIHPPPSKKVV